MNNQIRSVVTSDLSSVVMEHGIEFKIPLSRKKKKTKLFLFKNLSGSMTGTKLNGIVVCTSLPQMNQTEVSGMDYDKIPEKLKSFFRYEEETKLDAKGKEFTKKVAYGKAAAIIKSKGGVNTGKYGLPRGSAKNFSIDKLDIDFLKNNLYGEAKANYQKILSGEERKKKLRYGSPSSIGEWTRLVESKIKAIGVDAQDRVQSFLSYIGNPCTIGEPNFGDFYHLAMLLDSYDYFDVPTWKLTQKEDKSKIRVVNDKRKKTSHVYQKESLEKLIQLVIKYNEKLGEIPHAKYTMFVEHGLDNVKRHLFNNGSQTIGFTLTKEYFFK